MEKQELEQALREAQTKIAVLQQQLSDANAELEGLSYSVSHDLRAPLRAIKGFSEALVEDYSDRLDADAKRFIDIIITSSAQITRLMDAVLLLSRLGRQPMRPSPLDMHQIVSDLIPGYQAKAAPRVIEFKVNPMPEVQADAALVQQVWDSLLLNAIKFTLPREKAVIEVGVAPEHPATTFFVRDNGVGFDMNFAKKLFGMFQRFHTEKEFDGVGAGLAIAQRLIRRHGGRIWADAKVNGGATFFFTLPG